MVAVRGFPGASGVVASCPHGWPGVCATPPCPGVVPKRSRAPILPPGMSRRGTPGNGSHEVNHAGPAARGVRDVALLQRTAREYARPPGVRSGRVRAGLPASRLEQAAESNDPSSAEEVQVFPDYAGADHGPVSDWVAHRRATFLSFRAPTPPWARSHAKIHPEKALAFAGRCVKISGCFFKVIVRSKSGTFPVGVPKQFLIWSVRLLGTTSGREESHGYEPRG